jgi:hypothetical protein
MFGRGEIVFPLHNWAREGNVKGKKPMLNIKLPKDGLVSS